ncbi:MFS transporter [Nocardioides insulae]|uniref:MFS transporter n=1 Tax=Nocardioides insulae TaxID=394734 RepID=UPI00041885DF|nr:MFS transporter [Nocardioides insulae]
MTLTHPAEPARLDDTRPPEDHRLKAWGFTGLLMLLYIINWADKAIYGLVAQPLSEEFGLSQGTIGFIGSMFFVAMTAGSFLAGVMGRYFTLKWCLAIMAIGWSFAMLPLAFAGGFAILLLSRMFLGLLEGPSSPIIHTALYSWHPNEKRGLPSACMAACASIAKIAVAPVIAVIIATWGWRAAFFACAAIGLAWLLAWLPTWKVGPYGAETGRRSAAGADIASAAAAAEPTVPLLKIMTTRTFIGGAFACMTMYAIVTAVLTWLPSYFELGLGFSRVEAGAMFGFPSIASLVILFILTSLSDRLIARGATSRVLRGVVPAIGLLFTGAALTLLPYVDGKYFAVAFISIGYAFGASIFPLFNAGLSEIVPPRQLSAVLGVFMGIMVLGGIYGPWLTGLIVDAAATPVAGYTAAFQTFGLMALVGSLIALFGVNPERDKLKLRPHLAQPSRTEV